MELELDVYEYYHKLNIVDGQFKEIVTATLAPQYAIDLFHCHFEQAIVYICRYSATMESFLALDTLIQEEELTRKMKRRSWSDDGVSPKKFIFCKGQASRRVGQMCAP